MTPSTIVHKTLPHRAKVRAPHMYLEHRLRPEKGHAQQQLRTLTKGGVGRALFRGRPLLSQATTRERGEAGAP